MNTSMLDQRGARAGGFSQNKLRAMACYQPSRQNFTLSALLVRAEVCTPPSRPRALARLGLDFIPRSFLEPPCFLTGNTLTDTPGGLDCEQRATAWTYRMRLACVTAQSNQQIRKCTRLREDRHKEPSHRREHGLNAAARQHVPQSASKLEAVVTGQSLRRAAAHEPRVAERPGTRGCGFQERSRNSVAFLKQSSCAPREARGHSWRKS